MPIEETPVTFPELTRSASIESNPESRDGPANGTLVNIPVLDKAPSTVALSNVVLFEGPEKNLEVRFKPGVGQPDGLRSFSRKQLDHICEKARCEIMSKIENNHFDAYVLSESSLFVYKHKIILKTCGTTTLLRCLPVLLEYSSEIGLEMEYLCYSRKNFNFPDQQEFPHNSFNTEVEYLNEWFRDGQAFCMGPVSSDHWLMYVIDRTKETSNTSERHGVIFNVMMFDMDETQAGNFFKKKNPTAAAMGENGGIHGLFPGATVDAAAFDPCGYSVNAMSGPSYFTMHITPEKECSYASFETNSGMDASECLKNVLALFKPKRFTVVMSVDETVGAEYKDVTADKLIGTGANCYKRTARSVSQPAESFSCIMSNYALQSYCLQPPITA